MHWRHFAVGEQRHISHSIASQRGIHSVASQDIARRKEKHISLALASMQRGHTDHASWVSCNQRMVTARHRASAQAKSIH